MKIEILGMGCSNCKALEKNARKAAEELGLKADVVDVTDIQKIMGYGVMSTPAIAVDGKVKASGRVNSVEEIKEMLK